jgi:hypothetical protein
MFILKYFNKKWVNRMPLMVKHINTDIQWHQVRMDVTGSSD